MTDAGRHRPTAERHVPVLLETCVALLAEAAQQSGAVVIDATLGMGGHSAALLDRLPQAKVIGIDRDPQALTLASERLAWAGDRFVPVHATYDEIASVLADLGLESVCGVLMDLGVSSLQIDEVDRGFSYAHDAPLDMRMDPSQGPTAADILNSYGERDLTRILRDFGEERFAGRIARAIVQSRADHPWDRSGELVDLIRRSIPAAARGAGNPAKRTFQALRIEVNGELRTLERALPAAIESLAVGGRIVVMAYHSLEDRLVKREIAAGTVSSTPRGVPVELAGHEPYLRALVHGARKAGEDEIARNPRAASVRLRAAERIHSRGQRHAVWHSGPMDEGRR